MKLHKASEGSSGANIIILTGNPENLPKNYLAEREINYMKEQHQQHKLRNFEFNYLDNIVMVRIIELKDEFYQDAEKLRKEGKNAAVFLNNRKIESAEIFPAGIEEYLGIAFAEGMALSNYQFLRYKNDNENKLNTLQKLTLIDNHNKIGEKDLAQLQILIEAVYRARDWINEPLSHLNAPKLAERITELGKESGAHVEVLTQKKIETLKMGGILAVNKGSVDPATFSIMEWKPENPVNDKPIVLVGKGIVFDTGGMNLKPGQHMNNMKMDMAGAAIMANVTGAVAKAGLPLHVVALIPATDNRVDGNAYVTGDVVTMYDNTTVEVVNTDAEGRMIMADALAYAKKYDPELVIDAATLTGSAARAIGAHGIVAMGNATNEMQLLKESGYNVYERIAELPFWEEYAEELKSDIADLKHLGGAEGGAIHAGKFLEHFTGYPYLHLDIAGVAFTEKEKSYHGKGGMGYGLRLLFDFFIHRQ
ncbi:MAG: leucyl aminopeptidase family protein [Bacteroidales bacterium]|nr:leucyl aminopeptidase family protein [Bacteroidales bacterium]MCF8333101.1 leucyl aminopeptidase family protein [Bacteroidales bacterium]